MADAEEEGFFSYLSDDLKEYMYKDLNWLIPTYLCGGVFWSREDDEPQRPSTLPDGDISNLNKIIRHLLSRIIHWTLCPMLVQFWAPITTKEGRSFLTTRNQPFSLTSIYDELGVEGLWGKPCEQHLPGRVFKHQFPESTPNVEFYSITEYPQRDDALRCQVQQSLAFPVFESSTQRCVGVIEVVTPEEDLRLLIRDSYFGYGIHKNLEKFDDYGEDEDEDDYGEDVDAFRLNSSLDVTQLSPTEYPLAHYARKAGLSGCFAICLESNYTRNDVYVLELELSQSEVEVMQVDSSDQQLVNAINTGSNVGGTEHNNFAITCTQEKSTVKVSKRKGNKSGGTVKTSKRDGNNIGVKIKIPLEDIVQNSELSLEKAAKSLKVSKSTLKRVCRTFGVERWPPRKINKIGCSQLDESAPCVNSDHLPSTQSSATIVHTEPHDKMMQDANIVTIKAKYGEGITMKFRLSLSSRFVQLQREVAKRLNLKAGTYYVKYEDEDGELILIGCDEDLQDYMRDSRSLGRSSIVVLLEQKLPITDHKKNKN
ncbi:unnamed protein product [Camellia sinensis]